MQVTIKGYTFQLREPYRAGDVLTKAEAQALNGLRAENIQNNLRKWVGEATAGLTPGQLLPPEKILEIQTRVSSYDLQYKFTEKATPRFRLSDVELEALAVARERVAGNPANAGLEDEAREALVAETARLPGVVEAARERVEAKRLSLLGEF